MAATILAVTLLTPVLSQASPRGPQRPSVAAPCGLRGASHYRHVVWIVLENVGYSVVGSPAAPFLNSLATKCGLATNDVAVSHPSLPNYVAMTSGSTQGISDDAEPNLHALSPPNLFSQLQGNWRTLVESMPQACDQTTSGDYAARHNPAVYYVNLGSTCQTNDVPLTLPLDLSAAFTLIVPNLCNDMHSCPVSTGDRWLVHYVTSILSSAQYRLRSLALFITFDEGDSSVTNQIPTWVVAPSVPRGVRVGDAFTHYSLLRTTETLLGVALLGEAANAPSMIRPFHL